MVVLTAGHRHTNSAADVVVTECMSGWKNDGYMHPAKVRMVPVCGHDILAHIVVVDVEM